MENCPKCQSDQFKKLSLIYAEGSSNSKSVGVGVTGGGNVGVGVGASASITQLATKCAPPVRPKGEAGGLLGAMLIFGQIGISVATGAGWFYFFLVLIPGMIYVFSCSQQEEKKLTAKHNAALEDYNQKYLCLRCETVFNPFATNTVDAAEEALSVSTGPLVTKPEGLSIGEWHEQVIKANGIVREGSGYQWQGQYFNSFSETVDAINVGRS